MADLIRHNAWSFTLLALAALAMGAWAWPRIAARRSALARRAKPSRRRPDPVADVRRDAEELARHLAAHLDAKAERLERLIRQADERLSSLEQAAAEDLLGALEPSGAEERPSRSRAPRAVGAVAEPIASLDSDPVSRRVCELADQGRSPREIAHALGEHVGKVQLILALRG